MSKTAWVIRAMRHDDLPVILKIERQSPSPWSLGQLEGELYTDHGWSFTACDPTGDVPIGFILGRTVTDEAEILKLGILREHRRQGIAQLLIDHITDILRRQKVGQCFLELRRSNEAAYRLYEKNYFTVTAVRKNYYTDPKEDAICMNKTLEDLKP
ncbi:MAG: ribosomal protein S18-alanine N-acetyltransferase [Proteobacteria bacterium]|nr:ribosomal protein S18-alanine N-acetyltransferase [Pseudomonadota bacterium]MBU1715311.1 ribosomal protein S18-alanine N-acetyltransferase [Pseudomonadota bacterium]